MQFEEGVVFFSVEVVEADHYEGNGNLRGIVPTPVARMAKRPPVVDVSSWSVRILRKKSNRFSIVEYAIMKKCFMPLVRVLSIID